MAGLVPLKRSREGYRTNAKKIVSYIEKSYADRETSPIDLNQMTIYHDNLERYHAKLEELDAKILSQLPPEEVADETDKTVELEDAIWTCFSKISILQSQIATNPLANPASSTSGEQVKLPKLELPKYSGDPLHWQEFWDCFDSTIHKTEMSNIDKFKYLKNCLTGDAAKLVDGFRLIDVNYETVTEALKQRFGNPEVSIFAHFEHLLALPATGRDLSKLQGPYDECEKHIRSLVALGLGEDTFGRVFIPIILSKLPRNIRVELHIKNGSQLWTLANLRELFKQEITAQQIGDWTLHDKERSNNHNSQRSQSDSNQAKSGPRKRIPPTNTFVQSNKQVMKVSCVFCNGSHYSDQCLKVSNVQARRNMAQRNGNCFKCLSTKHRIAQCPKKSKCFHCSEASHHSAFCLKRSNRKSESTMCTFDQTNSHQETHGAFTAKDTTAFSAVSNGLVYMQMATVQYYDNTGMPFGARIYLDPGSSCSYVTEEVAKKLNLTSFGRATVANARFEDRTRSTKSYKRDHLPVPTQSGETLNVESFVTNHISVPLEKLPLSYDKYPILSNLPLAGSLSTKRETVNIDILIGGDYYYCIATGETIRLGDGLVLLGSKLGYITAGMVIDNSQRMLTRTANSMLIFSSNERKMRNVDVERFWSLEDIGIKDDPHQPDDDYAVDQFNKTIRMVNGRYEVGWPWKEPKPDLPTNEAIAFSRLKYMVRRLRSQPEVLKRYDATIQKQREEGTIEPVIADHLETNSSSLIHYLPHHCVVKEDKTTKLRVVYDASCKTSSKSLSLNECLLRGPIYLSDLCGLLLRFRTHRVVVVSDIEKAFLQVALRPQDRDVTRFYWLQNLNGPVLRNNLVTYRFTKVPFGIISSPFLLEATIRHHLRQREGSVAQQIAENIYVDNVICGVDSEEDAVAFYVEAKKLFQQIRMNLREWFTNSPGLKTILKAPDIGNGHITSVLGINWDSINDTISVKRVKFSTVQFPQTKRQVLQVASSVFDRCGFFTPITVRAKIFMQKLWKLQVSWDNPLTEELKAEWNPIAEDYVRCAASNLPRRAFKETHNNQIHCFCDASMKAYGAAVYIRSDRGESTLLFTKSRVAPTKPITLPRLELMAVLVGVRLVDFVIKQLHFVRFDGLFVWTDSKCVLHWIASSKLTSIFVANRICEIKKYNYSYRYVPTAMNPADLPSNGITHHSLSESKLWWHGPAFLRASPECWLPTDLRSEVDAMDTDNPQEMTMVNLECDTGLVIDVKKFVTFNKHLTITAFVLRFISKLKQQHIDFKGPRNDHVGRTPDACEISSAKLFWIFLLQRSLNMKANSISHLGLSKDDSGLWRCQGRLDNAELIRTAKYPILLPTRHPVVDLIIQDFHFRSGHSGCNGTMASIRSQYWIPKLRPRVKSVLRNCNICKVWEGKPYKSPRQAQLPGFRIESNWPFANTGIDYMGPLHVKDSDAIKKVWICLFTSATTRAIHLEVVNDMTCHEFLLCLRRFIALQGKPNTIISDNAKGFKLANDVLQRLWHSTISDDHIKRFLSNQEIKWIFIPEHTPWMGGFYERLVGSVERCLKKIIGRQRLSFIQLQTLAYEVSSILNNRPLLMSEDINDTILTPAMLLGQRRHLSFCPEATSKNDEFVPELRLKDKLVQRWKLLNESLKQFWDTWRTQYLTSLREAHGLFLKEHGHAFDTPSIGSVVLVGERLPRSQWKLAKIVELPTSHDGFIRKAVLQLPNKSVITRPIKLLYPVETDIGTTISDPNNATERHTIKSISDTIDIANNRDTDRLIDNDNVCRSGASQKGLRVANELAHSSVDRFGETCIGQANNHQTRTCNIERPKRKAAVRAKALIRELVEDVSDYSDPE